MTVCLIITLKDHITELCWSLMDYVIRLSFQMQQNVQSSDQHCDVSLLLLPVTRLHISLC